MHMFGSNMSRLALCDLVYVLNWYGLVDKMPELILIK